MRRLFASLGGLIGPCSNEKFILSPLIILLHSSTYYIIIAVRKKVNIRKSNENHLWHLRGYVIELRSKENPENEGIGS
jgi:hypothetical protein